jgi:hypothetical protein
MWSLFLNVHFLLLVLWPEAAAAPNANRLARPLLIIQGSRYRYRLPSTLGSQVKRAALVVIRRAARPDGKLVISMKVYRIFCYINIALG